MAAHNPNPSANIPYDPLATHQPPSPLLQSGFNVEPPAPRFYSDAPVGGYRDSYASSVDQLGTGGHTPYQGSDYGSVQNLAAGADSRTYGSGGPGGSSLMQEAYRDDVGGGGYNDVPMSNLSRGRSADKNELYAAPKTQAKRTGVKIAIVAGILVVIAAGAGLGVYFGVIRPKSLASNGGSGGGSSSSPSTTGGSNNSPTKPTVAITGGAGSRVTTDSGSTFIYNNTFGGFWVSDPSNPFDNSAQAQSYTPPLNQSWNYGVDRIYGVNIGGWLNLEPFISPALYQKYQTGAVRAVDEWTLSTAMAADVAGGGLNQIEDHYKTFITEEDFAAIAAAGLNWVRIPIPFWAIEKYPEEPFLEKVSWGYFLKAIGWARKYGLRINIDLHALPGSQNGWNHSGQLGPINFLNGVMGWANAQRGLDYIRIIAEFVSQPQYKDVIPFFGITNEAGIGEGSIPRTVISQFYYEAHQIIRSITGIGGGPMISIHDGFSGLDTWAGFLSGSDRIALDTHPYFAFGGPQPDPPAAFLTRPCTAWAAGVATSNSAFGFTAAGEFSLAINDCGLFVNGVGLGTRYEGDFTGGASTPIGSCSEWTNYKAWSPARRNDFKEFMKSSTDALQNWFFWTWRIGAAASGEIEAPFWSYKLGLEEGWIPADPREAEGQCDKVGSPFAAFKGPYQPWQTGGAGAGDISAAQLAQFGTWPPTQVGGQPNINILPQYTATGPIPTLPVPTYYKPGSTKDTFDAGTGWTSKTDTTLMSVPIQGCTYPPIWNSATAAVPAQCALAHAPAPSR